MARYRNEDSVLAMFNRFFHLCETKEQKTLVLDMKQAFLEIIPSDATTKSAWISVDERLPEDGVWVLGYSAKSGRGGLCNCLNSYVREFGNYDDTTHWLPLPEFPKKKGE